MNDNRRHKDRPLRLVPGSGKPDEVQPAGFPPALPRPGVPDEVWPPGPRPAPDTFAPIPRKK